jgi:hypothetical protein
MYTTLLRTRIETHKKLFVKPERGNGEVSVDGRII